MKQQKAKLWSDELREAIRSAPMSLRELSRQTGVDKAVLSKFVNKKVGLSVTSIDAVCQCLGLGLTQLRKPQAKRDR